MTDDTPPIPTTVVVVDAKSGPWDWEKGGLNKYYAYGNGKHRPPAVFKGLDGKGLVPDKFSPSATSRGVVALGIRATIIPTVRRVIRKPMRVHIRAIAAKSFLVCM